MRSLKCSINWPLREEEKEDEEGLGRDEEKEKKRLFGNLRKNVSFILGIIFAWCTRTVLPFWRSGNTTRDSQRAIGHGALHTHTHTQYSRWSVCDDPQTLWRCSALPALAASSSARTPLFPRWRAELLPGLQSGAAARKVDARRDLARYFDLFRNWRSSYKDPRQARTWLRAAAKKKQVEKKKKFRSFGEKICIIKCKNETTLFIFYEYIATIVDGTHSEHFSAVSYCANL